MNEYKEKSRLTIQRTDREGEEVRGKNRVGIKKYKLLHKTSHKDILYNTGTRASIS